MPRRTTKEQRERAKEEGGKGTNKSEGAIGRNSQRDHPAKERWANARPGRGRTQRANANGHIASKACVSLCLPCGLSPEKPRGEARSAHSRVRNPGEGPAHPHTRANSVIEVSSFPPSLARSFLLRTGSSGGKTKKARQDSCLPPSLSLSRSLYRTPEEWNLLGESGDFGARYEAGASSEETRMWGMEKNEADQIRRDGSDGKKARLASCRVCLLGS